MDRFVDGFRMCNGYQHQLVCVAFVFVFSLAWGIRDRVHDETCSAKPLLLAGLSLMIIIGGLLGYSA